MTRTELGSAKNPFDVIIVGGGLSGLFVARNLSSSKKWKLLEANERLGGRLQNDRAGNMIDLGGAWLWPHQKKINKVVKSLEMKTFLQPGDPSSLRVVGGAAEIVQKIAEELFSKSDNASSIELNCPVVGCRRLSDKLLSVELFSGIFLYTNSVCFACPPKLIHLHIHFDPPLCSSKTLAMESSKTWMAGVTKVALVYHSSKFWPEYESNGGFRPGQNQPAFQYYDASPEDGSVCALTFFTISSLSNENNNDKKLANDCADQFCKSLSKDTISNFPNMEERIRGYDEIHVKRWPLEKYISEDADPMDVAPHPEPNWDLAKSDWDGMLVFAGTETDLVSPGVMEGAINAANRATNELEILLN